MILSIYTHHTAKEVLILLLFYDVFHYYYYTESQILTRSIFVSSFLSEDNWNSCLFHHVRFYSFTGNRRAVSVEFQETGDLGHKNIMGRKKERWYGCIATWVGCGHFRWVSHSPAIVKSLRETMLLKSHSVFQCLQWFEILQRSHDVFIVDWIHQLLWTRKQIKFIYNCLIFPLTNLNTIKLLEHHKIIVLQMHHPSTMASTYIRCIMFSVKLA